MLLMGDEIGRSQFGNNNGYCQDTEMSWLNWGEDGDQEVAFRDFTAGLVRLRQELGIFHLPRFLHGDPLNGQDGAKDICWLRPDGEEMNDDDWHAVDPKVLGMVLADGDTRALVFFNALEEAMTFNLCDPLASMPSSVLFETAEGTAHRPFRGPPGHAPFEVPGRSMLGLIGRRQT